MRPQMLAFFALILIVGNLLCLMADGAWLGADDQAQMNALTGHSVKATGDIPVVTPVVNFFSGAWRIFSWDFSFFDGALQIIRWILLTLTIMAIYAVGMEFRSTITSLFGRR